MKNMLLGLWMLTVILPFVLVSQEKNGTIRGKVVSASQQEPLIGVNVILRGTTRGAATGNDGSYTITGVPAGSYTLEFHYIGYDRLMKTDVIVRPGRITYVNAELSESAIASEEIVVTAGYFPKKETEPQSNVQFNGEEVRRSPAAGGDVSRILSVLPSVAQVADNVNDLAVRGGSPAENGFYVDHIPITNINHFPVQGSSGGPIGMINTDFIDEVTFYSGGFSALYGDRLSSVMNMTFREGNREEYDGQLDLSMGGMGGIVEGPLGNKKGSFLVALRRSYLDWVVKALSTAGAVPRYGDLHAKSVYDITPNNQLTFLNITGLSSIRFSRSESEKNGNNGYGTSRALQTVTGLNWKRLWSPAHFSNTSLSYRRLTVLNEFHMTKNSALITDNESTESAVHLRHHHVWSGNPHHRLEWGGDLVLTMENYDVRFGSLVNRLGDTLPPLMLDRRYQSYKAGGFFSYSWTPRPFLTLTLGVRGDYFRYNRNYSVAPRLSALARITRRWNLYAAWGWYYQNLPMILLAQDEKNKDLKDPRAFHAVLGTDYLLTEDTKLTIESYLKNYDRFPMTPSDPMLFVMDESGSMSRFGRYVDLQDNGKAQTYGIEITIQKKLAQKLYGLISGTYFRSRYRDLSGHWHNRIYDNRYIFNIVGGYKPNPRWEFSVRWVYAGGVPYTPFDEILSQQLNTGVIDATRINAERYPDYHTLNLRFDRRFYFKNSALVTYLNLYNTYNRKNIATYYWNEIKNKRDKIYQWSLIPVGGFEYEF